MGAERTEEMSRVPKETELVGNEFDIEWGALVGPDLPTRVRVEGERPGGWLLVQEVDDDGEPTGPKLWLSPAHVLFLLVPDGE